MRSRPAAGGRRAAGAGGGSSSDRVKELPTNTATCSRSRVSRVRSALASLLGVLLLAFGAPGVAQLQTQQDEAILRALAGTGGASEPPLQPALVGSR